MVRPKKHLGQHFLRDESVAQRIADLLTPNGGFETIIEIGPGTGVLTKYLLDRPEELKLIEIDGESVVYLSENYPQLDGKIYPADFLQLDLKKFITGPTALIGNYPYNISSQIMFKALENREHFIEIGGMFQKEVAERLVSPPGSKKYGILSVLLEAYFEREYLFTVEPDVFYPPPKVQSGVIRIKAKENPMTEVSYKKLSMIVKIAFGQRRKTLKNALKSLNLDLNSTEELLLNKRAEQLGVEEFVTLALKLENNGL